MSTSANELQQDFVLIRRRCRRGLLVLGTVLGLAACSDAERGEREVAALHPQAGAASIGFAQLRPILARRCVVCHACYDASCQLNLSTWEGIERGASKARVYDASRLQAAEPSRLFVDADSVAEWRQRGFFPVLNEEEGDPAAGRNLENSLLYRMLRLKQARPLPVAEDGRLRDEFDFSLAREWSCPTLDEFDDYAEQHPFAGMPYGLPALGDAEMRVLEGWIAGGARGADPEPDLGRYRGAIERWESFLNRDSRHGQLVARYIYEHLYLGNLYFPEIDAALYFRLVRSSSAPGKPVARIATRRPFDDPGVARVHYRLLPIKAHIVAKTHMPYALDTARLERFEALFFDTDIEVAKLPSYAPEQASNPFLTFRDLPAGARYRFMLEHSEFTIRGFMKGAVCRGQVALNVIDDRFWVIFTSPDDASMKSFNEFLVSQASNLSLPAEAESTAEPLLNWVEFSADQQAYLAAKRAFLDAKLFDRQPLDLGWLWDGDGDNRNAALTVFRHFDSASVRRGLLGRAPKTAWLIDYPILERIHYLLVAGFDVYGNAGHQLLTRMYMDFLRMESEFNFLTLLPARSRSEIGSYWYRDASEDVKDYVFGEHARIERETDIDYSGSDHLSELYDRLREHLAPVLDDSGELLTRRERLTDYRRLQALEDLVGRAASLMPEMSLVMIEAEPPALLTILRDSAHSNISGLFDEASRRLPREDRLTVLPGSVGAYPDALWRLTPAELPAFIAAVESLRAEGDYAALMRRFGVRRSNPEFWSFSDRVHRLLQADYPVDYGLLDYNRLENR